MHILIVYKTFHPDTFGGVEEAIRNICLATKAFGIRTTVLVLSKTPTPEVINVDGIIVYRQKSIFDLLSCDIGGLRSFLLFRKLAKEVDVVHFFIPWPFADFLKAFQPKKKPTIVTYISDVVRQKKAFFYYKPILLATLRSAEVIAVSSPNYFLSSQVLQGNGIRDKVKIIPLGIIDDTEPIPSQTPESISTNDPYFLFVGVLRYYKGVEYLIQAAKSITTKVIIVGDGPRKQYLTNLANRLNAHNVTFLGKVPNVVKKNLIKNSLAVVLPSHLRSEAFGMILVEACLHGKAMISCEISTGTSFINLDGVTGIVVAPRNIEALSDALRSLASDHSLARKYGAAARKRYSEFFSGDQLALNYISAYQKAIDDRIGNEHR